MTPLNRSPAASTLRTSSRQGRDRRLGGMVSLPTLLLIVLGGLALFTAVRTAPSIQEYYLIKGLVQRIAESGPATPFDAQGAFDRQRAIDGISAIEGKDLNIARVAGVLTIDFTYQKVVPLAGPVSLLIDFSGSSRRGGG